MTSGKPIDLSVLTDRAKIEFQTAPLFSPDSQSFWVVGKDHHLYEFDLASMSLRHQIALPHQMVYSTIQWTADGKTLLHSSSVPNLEPTTKSFDLIDTSSGVITSIPFYLPSSDYRVSHFQYGPKSNTILMLTYNKKDKPSDSDSSKQIATKYNLSSPGYSRYELPLNSGLGDTGTVSLMPGGNAILDLNRGIEVY